MELWNAKRGFVMECLKRYNGGGCLKGCVGVSEEVFEGVLKGYLEECV